MTCLAFPRFRVLRRSCAAGHLPISPNIASLVSIKEHQNVYVGFATYLKVIKDQAQLSHPEPEATLDFKACQEKQAALRPGHEALRCGLTESGPGNSPANRRKSHTFFLVNRNSRNGVFGRQSRRLDSVLVESLLDRRGVGANNLLSLGAILEDHEGGHGADAELLAQVGDLVDVDLDEVDVGVLLLVGPAGRAQTLAYSSCKRDLDGTRDGERVCFLLNELGSDGLAGTAPGGEAVEDGNLLDGDLGVGRNGLAVDDAVELLLAVGGWSARVCSAHAARRAERA